MACLIDAGQSFAQVFTNSSSIYSLWIWFKCSLQSSRSSLTAALSECPEGLVFGLNGYKWGNNRGQLALKLKQTFCKCGRRFHHTPFIRCFDFQVVSAWSNRSTLRRPHQIHQLSKVCTHILGLRTSHWCESPPHFKISNISVALPDTTESCKLAMLVLRCSWGGSNMGPKMLFINALVDPLLLSRLLVRLISFAHFSLLSGMWHWRCQKRHFIWKHRWVRRRNQPRLLVIKTVIVAFFFFSCPVSPLHLLTSHQPMQVASSAASCRCRWFPIFLTHRLSRAVCCISLDHTLGEIHPAQFLWWSSRTSLGLSGFYFEVFLGPLTVPMEEIKIFRSDTLIFIFCLGVIAMSSNSNDTPQFLWVFAILG